MRRYTVLLALGWSGVILGGMTSASAGDRPAPEAGKAREAFVKLLLPDGVRRSPARPGVAAVNAFDPPPGVTPNGPPAGRPPATPVRPQRPGNRPTD